MELIAELSRNGRVISRHPYEIQNKEFMEGAIPLVVDDVIKKAIANIPDLRQKIRATLEAVSRRKKVDMEMMSVKRGRKTYKMVLLAEDAPRLVAALRPDDIPSRAHGVVTAHFPSRDADAAIRFGMAIVRKEDGATGQLATHADIPEKYDDIDPRDAIAVQKALTSTSAVLDCAMALAKELFPAAGGGDFEYRVESGRVVAENDMFSCTISTTIVPTNPDEKARNAAEIESAIAAWGGGTPTRRAN